MALRASRLMAERLKEMLTRDKLGGEGFPAALKRDCARLLGDYFALAGEPEIAVSQREDGGYDITVRAQAHEIRRFRTTEDLPMPEI